MYGGRKFYQCLISGITRLVLHSHRMIVKHLSDVNCSSASLRVNNKLIHRQLISFILTNLVNVFTLKLNSKINASFNEDFVVVCI